MDEEEELVEEEELEELPPPALTETRAEDGSITVTGTEGDDAVVVSEHRSTLVDLTDWGLGEITYADGITVTSGETSMDYLGEDANHVTISTGAGGDVVVVADDVTQGVHIDAGAGDDLVFGGSGNDVIEGGEGRDLLDGGAGRDYLEGGLGNDTVTGGAGNDVLYGGQGNDVMDGGKGDDYVEGGKGDDTLWGGQGNDTVSGGRGDDRIAGDDGNDVLYTGEGNDRAWGGEGDDTTYAGAADKVDGGPGNDTTTAVEFRGDVGSSISVTTGLDDDMDITTPAVALDAAEGAAFQDRVEDDLDLLRSSPTGQQLLEGIDSSGHTIDITRTDVANSSAVWNDFGQPGDVAPVLDASGNPVVQPDGTVGQDATVAYNPALTATFAGKEETPIEILNHELSHGWNEVTGTLQSGTFQGDPGDPDNGTSNFERQAVGLPNTGVPFDHDGDPTTPDQTDNPDFATERGLSRELGREERPSYN